MTDYTNLDDLLDCLLVALGEEGHGLGRPHGRVQQPLPVRVLANLFQNLPIIGCKGGQKIITIDPFLLHRSIDITEIQELAMVFWMTFTGVDDDQPVPAILVGRGAVPDVCLQVAVVGVALVAVHDSPPDPSHTQTYPAHIWSKVYKIKPNICSLSRLTHSTYD